MFADVLIRAPNSHHEVHSRQTKADEFIQNFLEVRSLKVP